MISVVCDSNVVLKWFHEDGEEQVDEARALLGAHRARDRVVLEIIELTFYELANVLIDRKGWSAGDTADQLEDLRVICRSRLPQPAELRSAADLAVEHGLSFYDALYAASARAHGGVLVTLDAQLLAAELGRSPAALTVQLGLGPSR